MKLSIILYLYEKVAFLKDVYNSLLNQDNKDFELIIINDNAKQKVEEVFSNLPIDDKKISVIRLFENFGRSYSYNLVTEKAKGDYIFFAEANYLFAKNFVSTVLNVIENNNYDYLSFKTGNDDINDMVKQDLEISNDIEENKLWLANCTITIVNKIFRRKFLEKNKISFTNFKNFYPLYFFKVMTTFKKAYFINKNLLQIKVEPNSTYKYSYNLYNILEVTYTLASEIKTLFANNQLATNIYNLWLIKLCLKDFLIKMFYSYDREKILAIAVQRAYEVIVKIDPFFYKNEAIKYIANPSLANYFTNFKPTFKYVKKHLFRILHVK